MNVFCLRLGFCVSLFFNLLPPEALCSSHDFAVRFETSTDGCGNAGCTQQTFRGERIGPGSVERIGRLRNSWFSCKIYWKLWTETHILKDLLIYTYIYTVVLKQLHWLKVYETPAKWEVSPCWLVHNFFHSFSLPWLCGPQEVLADAMSGGLAKCDLWDLILRFKETPFFVKVLLC